MATLYGTGKQVSGAQDDIGGRFYNTVDWSPSSNIAAGGDYISPNQFGFNSVIQSIQANELDTTGLYYIRVQPLAGGINTGAWKTRYFLLSSGAEQTGTGLTALIFKLSAVGY